MRWRWRSTLRESGGRRVCAASSSIAASKRPASPDGTLTICTARLLTSHAGFEAVAGSPWSSSSPNHDRAVQAARALEHMDVASANQRHRVRLDA
jgi:hypothetical protein